MNKCDKTQEAQTHLNNREHYKLLKNAMAEETLQRVNELVTRLHQNNFIDDMTKKWFSQTHNPPRIPIFYTLTKIHKQKPVSRPIISGCEGPSERLSSSVDKLLQPIAQTQNSYLKDTTHFINFIEKTKVPQNTILMSMDVTSLYTNIPQEEGITTVCKAYEKFHNYNPPIPSHHLKEMLCLILKENSFQFYWKKLPPDPWNRNGYKNGSCICQHLHGRNRNKIDKPKQHKTSKVESLYLRHFLIVGFQHTGNKPVHKTS
ncbi:uncharacterized protein [Montipora capricornis]|uniref:uncharacterized protein n=1 Tax=Montipora capricornis TaxID=246305 RepID=UPI0035F208C8